MEPTSSSSVKCFGRASLVAGRSSPLTSFSSTQIFAIFDTVADNLTALPLLLLLTLTCSCLAVHAAATPLDRIGGCTGSPTMTAPGTPVTDGFPGIRLAHVGDDLSDSHRAIEAKIAVESRILATKTVSRSQGGELLVWSYFIGYRPAECCSV